THFDYRLAGGAWARLPDERIVAAPAWEWTTVELRACNSDASCSDPRASDEPAMAYGTPAAPTDLVAVPQTGQTDNVEVSFAFAAPADLGPWELTYLVEWGEGATAGTSSGTLGAERLIILTGVAPPAQTGTLQICVRGTSACSSAPFDIPAATP